MPSPGPKRSVILMLRTTADERAEIDRAAVAEGDTYTGAWARRELVKLAREVLRRRSPETLGEKLEVEAHKRHSDPASNPGCRLCAVGAWK